MLGHLDFVRRSDGAELEVAVGHCGRLQALADLFGRAAVDGAFAASNAGLGGIAVERVLLAVEPQHVGETLDYPSSALSPWPGSSEFGADLHRPRRT